MALHEYQELHVFSLDGNIGLKLLEAHQWVPHLQKACRAESAQECSARSCAPSPAGLAASASPPQPSGTLYLTAGTSLPSGKEMRSTWSISLLPAGSWLPESHKEPFHGLHKQERQERLSAQSITSSSSSGKDSQNNLFPKPHALLSMLLGFMD